MHIPGSCDSLPAGDERDHSPDPGGIGAGGQDGLHSDLCRSSRGHGHIAAPGGDPDPEPGVRTPGVSGECSPGVYEVI